MNILLLDFNKSFKKKNRIICNKNDLLNIFFSTENHFEIDYYNTIIQKLYLNYPTFKRWINEEPPFDDYIKYIYNFTNFLKIKKIKTIISNASVPHHLEELIIEISCDLLNIDIIYFYPLFFKNNSKQYPNCIPLLKKNNIKKLSILNLKASHIKFDNYFDNSLDEYEKDDRSKKYTLGSNFYLSILYLIYSNIRLRNIRSKNLYRSFFFANLRFLYSQKKSLDFYNKNISKNISTKKKSIIYMAHFQPEASSWPLGGYLNNQLHLMLIIKSIFPKYDLYYKEHYKSFIYFQKKIGHLKVGKYRTRSYYQNLINEKIRLVDINHNPKDIPDNFIVITMTGNIALTRALNGKPTVITGYPWYKDLSLDGIYHLNDHINIKKNYFKKKKINSANNKSKILNSINHNSAKVVNGVIDQKDANLFIEKYEKN